jgi:hypothetical protein
MSTSLTQEAVSSKDDDFWVKRQEELIPKLTDEEYGNFEQALLMQKFKTNEQISLNGTEKVYSCLEWSSNQVQTRTMLKNGLQSEKKTNPFVLYPELRKTHRCAS